MLILLTSSFPYGTGEAFLENEMPFLEKAFERIVIISNATTKGNERPVAAHVQVISQPYHLTTAQKVFSLKGVLSPLVREEFKTIRHSYKLGLSTRIINTVLHSYYKAQQTALLLDKLLQGTDLTTVTLYSYWADDNAMACAYYRKLHPAVKAITRAHAWDIYFERHTPAYLPFRNFILQHLNACYCISQNGVEYINKLTALQYTDKIHLARLGTLRHNNTLPATPSTPVIISCSNIIPLKRVNLIIEALATINTPVEWIHFGSGPLLNTMKELAAGLLATKPHVHYTFTGQVSNTDVLKYYAASPASVFINVSETEGLPVSIMEAMSFGIPAIATNVGGVKEIVTDNKNGVLLPPNPTVNEVAAALQSFLSLSAEQSTAMRQAAYKTWYEQYNADKNFPAFVQSVTAL